MDGQIQMGRAKRVRATVCLCAWQLGAFLIVIFFPSLAFAAEGSWVAKKTGIPADLLADLGWLLLGAGPILGNLLARGFTRLKWYKVAAYAARWAPFATRTTSSVIAAPTRDQAIRAILLEAEKEPELGPISKAASHLLRVKPNGDETPILEALERKE